jgi:hypothetical protein
MKIQKTMQEMLMPLGEKSVINKNTNTNTSILVLLILLHTNLYLPLFQYHQLFPSLLPPFLLLLLLLLGVVVMFLPLLAQLQQCELV